MNPERLITACGTKCNLPSGRKEKEVLLSNLCEECSCTSESGSLSSGVYNSVGVYSRCLGCVKDKWDKMGFPHLYNRQRKVSELKITRTLFFFEDISQTVPLWRNVLSWKSVRDNLNMFNHGKYMYFLLEKLLYLLFAFCLFASYKTEPLPLVMSYKQGNPTW